MRKNTAVRLFFALLAATASTVSAEEDPQPLWNPGNWDHASWANEATTKHLSLFLTARSARIHCPADDTVVWLDRQTGLFYGADRPDYGAGNSGYFVCERQARIIGAQPAPLR